MVIALNELPELSEELVRSLDLPANLPEEMSISEVVALIEISAHALRYYERIGLVEVGRNSAGRRSYDRQALARVVFVTRLRMSGMPVRNIAHYLELVKQGESTVPDRLALLQAHRDSICQQLRDLQLALAVVNYKIATYGGHCSP